MTETLYRGGRPIGGFAIGGASPTTAPPATPVLASLMTGAAAGLLLSVLHAPLWSSIIVGAGAAVTTKYLIDRT